MEPYAASDLLHHASTAATAAHQHLSPPLQIALYAGALSLLATAIVSVTCFTRVVIVLSFVRRALSAPEIPPNPVLMSLSMLITLFIMRPTFTQIYDKAILPYSKSELSFEKSIEVASSEMVAFMLKHTRERDLELFMAMSGESEADIQSARFTTVAPAFICSEIRTAFIMGFCIYMPFLLIDLISSTLLMSLGMMMTPPVVISTPLKILLFILTDGWTRTIQALAESYL